LVANVIHLAWLGNTTTPPSWSLGTVHALKPTSDAVSDLMRDAAGMPSDAWLFWDGALGPPDERTITQVFGRRGDLWHAGLALGLAGQPQLLDLVAPTWMLNRDPSPLIEATSWRVSFRACLVRSDVLRSIEPMCNTFHTLEGAGLEYGHRCLSLGAVTRHVPELLPDRTEYPTVTLPIEDQLEFVVRRYGTRWARWAMLRAILSGLITLRAAASAWRARQKAPRENVEVPLSAHRGLPSEGDLDKKVTVLIPTLDRYPFLRKLLGQLRGQTVSPSEIIIVDQTDVSQRKDGLYEEFYDLPMQVHYLDKKGQSSARNLGLRHARGDLVLFLDDDDEIPDTLVERHLKALAISGADVSCGAADEPGALKTDQLQYPQVSRVLPTNNSLARLGAVMGAGGFDTAFDGGQNEDHDLGMRVYLSGGLMMLHPNIVVVHHHASSGGLRAHGSRVITRGSSRQKLLHRNLPTPWELYLAKRYFTPEQVKEVLWLRALTTFSLRGSRLRKVLKVTIALVLLPDTWRRMKANERVAEGLLRQTGGPYGEPPRSEQRGRDRS
jgi:glycosyltransferase involved in cell wall biosynthesis